MNSRSALSDRRVARCRSSPLNERRACFSRGCVCLTVAISLCTSSHASTIHASNARAGALVIHLSAGVGHHTGGSRSTPTVGRGEEGGRERGERRSWRWGSSGGRSRWGAVPGGGQHVAFFVVSRPSFHMFPILCGFFAELCWCSGRCHFKRT